MQDEASQLVTLLAGDRPVPRVLDTCASPGGKTTAIAAPMEGRGLLVACDVRDRRIDLLRRTVAASGATNVASCRPTARSRCPSRARSTACWSTRPARASARCGAIPTSAGAGAKQDLPALAAAELTMLQHAAAARRAGRTPGLRHLLERAGRKRRRRGRVSRDDAEFTPLHAGRGDVARSPPTLVDAARPSPHRSRTCTASKRSSARCSKRHVQQLNRHALGERWQPAVYDLSRRWPFETARLERGKTRGARRRPARAPTCCLRRRRCASRLRAREVQVPDFTNRTANEATRARRGSRPRRSRWTTPRRPDPKIARRPGDRAGAGRRLDRAPPAQRQGVAQRRARARRRCRC